MLYINRYYSGHSRVRCQELYSVDRCGNCGGANCDWCEMVYQVREEGNDDFYENFSNLDDAKELIESMKNKK